MLTIFGGVDRRSGFCDKLSRRSFLQIGGAAAGGLALHQILCMEAEAAVGSSDKSIINIYLPGGPSHLDMWDLKPNAPAEIRGEFNPTRTNVPGIQICELFPRVAKMMDKFAIIRSLSDSDGRHDCYQCMTGRKKNERGPNGGWPSAGALRAADDGIEVPNHRTRALRGWNTAHHGFGRCPGFARWHVYRFGRALHPVVATGATCAARLARGP